MFSVKFFIYVAIQFFNLEIITCINATKMFALNKSYNLFL